MRLCGFPTKQAVSGLSENAWRGSAPETGMQERMTVNKEHEIRIDKLEVDLAHATQTIDDLNEVIIKQGRQIDQLTQRFSLMTDQVEEMIESALPGHQVEKPPHY